MIWLILYSLQDDHSLAIYSAWQVPAVSTYAHQRTYSLLLVFHCHTGFRPLI